jgi:hypothetical protein
MAAAMHDRLIPGLMLAVGAIALLLITRQLASGVESSTSTVADFPNNEIGDIMRTTEGLRDVLLDCDRSVRDAAAEVTAAVHRSAEEVRKLAEDSKSTASEISALIGAIQTETTGVVAVVEDGARRTVDGAAVVARARTAFVTIGEVVADMAGRVDEIAAVSQEIIAAGTVQDNVSEVAVVAEREPRRSAGAQARR